MGKNKTILTNICYHCGNNCDTNAIMVSEKYFCCNGCKSVFQILNENDLCTFYELNKNPGVSLKNEIRKDKFIFLDNEEINNKLIQFRNNNIVHVTFYIPQIHCSSCLWVLENIYVLDKGIESIQINFTRKEVFIVFQEKKTSLRNIVEILAKIGYEPHLSLNDLSNNVHKKTDRTRWYKIGVAGFCFANIMMLSFSEYLSSTNAIESNISNFFKILTLTLSLPVLFYAATEFFTSAWYGIKNKYLNIDFPVVLAISITFIRSIYDIFTNNGSGYLDSMSGIVFFMLIGRWLQSRTNQSISFDRDYKSFFPISINKIVHDIITPISVSNIKQNDIIQIRTNDIVPVDGILSKGNALIDYSFVSGESEATRINVGEIIYAGGKQLNGNIELIVIKELSQSYLTNLWNNPIFSKNELPKKTMIDTIGKYFTYIVLLIGFVSGIYWFANNNYTYMLNAITTVLIVACPCALLLAQNYTNGHVLRIFNLNNLYLKSPEIIGKISKINHIVFDKTGTLTQNGEQTVTYEGDELNKEEKQIIASLVNYSSHPLSNSISNYLNCTKLIAIDNYKEYEGKGIEGWINDTHVKIGSIDFVGNTINSSIKGAKVVVKIENKVIGVFTISNKYRIGIIQLLKKLKEKFSLSILSGDNNNELNTIQQIVGTENEILFNQTPQQKLDYINLLQKNKKLNVMMVGDGLNDSGALKQSNVGVSVSELNNNFTPSSDCIIGSEQLIKLHEYISMAKDSEKIIYLTFGISVIYNLVGLYYAIQGILSPVIAAILMPLSSITIIIITYGLTQLLAKKHNLIKINK